MQPAERPEHQFGIRQTARIRLRFEIECLSQTSERVQTIPGKGWNTHLRLYGPLELWFNPSTSSGQARRGGRGGRALRSHTPRRPHS
jgi:hypothetical protein